MKYLDGRWVDKEGCINQYERLIYKIASPFALQKNHTGLTIDDLFQVGAIGLLRAYDDYDIERGTKFMTIAHYRVFGAVSGAVRDLGGIVRYPAYYHETLQKINKHNLTEKTPEEIAKELGVTVNRATISLSMMNANKHLDEKTDKESEAYYKYGEKDDTSWMYVEEYLDILTERERHIVLAKLKGKSGLEIGRELNVSRQLICNIARGAKDKYEAFEMGWRGGAHQKV
ncbi:sigma-70 family RNA polymerase sigma factor [Halobacillus salinus]|uniref:sigma-70 family RNA polymerase sigma factor n=1 Tax=Halobacillus salinus TaxID=192814 RepID=UPI0009A856A7|nr:sigma-70 family RNA polymerase sigma factor [Halobacillus salinus]